MVPSIRKPGEQLRDIRLRLGITVREVAEESQKIAELEGNPEFAISNPWLSQLENSSSVPSIFKLYSLSSIYRFKFTDLVALFGVDLQRLPQRQLAARLPNTHLVTVEDPDPEKTVSFPIQFDRGFNLDNTNLLSRMVEIWGDVPIALIQRLDIRHGKYGYIGLQDLTMYPLLRPGSFVQIDTELGNIRRCRGARNTIGRFTSSNCGTGMRVRGARFKTGNLLLMPHPLSHCKIRRFVYSAEAEIVGRVTAVAMRLNDPAGNFRFDRSTSKAKLTFEMKRAALVGWVSTGTITRNGSTPARRGRNPRDFREWNAYSVRARGRDSSSDEETNSRNTSRWANSRAFAATFGVKRSARPE